MRAINFIIKNIKMVSVENWKINNCTPKNHHFLWTPTHIYTHIHTTARVNWVFSDRVKTKSTTATTFTSATAVACALDSMWLQMDGICKRYPWCFDHKRMFIENTFSEWNHSLFLEHNTWFQENPEQYCTIKINNNVEMWLVAVSEIWNLRHKNKWSKNRIDFRRMKKINK